MLHVLYKTMMFGRHINKRDCVRVSFVTKQYDPRATKSNTPTKSQHKEVQYTDQESAQGSPIHRPRVSTRKSNTSTKSQHKEVQYTDQESIQGRNITLRQAM